MSDIAWSPEPREVPVELVTNPHVTYPPKKVFWASLADKVDGATWDQLKEMARGGIGEPNG